MSEGSTLSLAAAEALARRLRANADAAAGRMREQREAAEWREKQATKTISDSLLRGQPWPEGGDDDRRGKTNGP